MDKCKQCNNIFRFIQSTQILSLVIISGVNKGKYFLNNFFSKEASFFGFKHLDR